MKPRLEGWEVYVPRHANDGKEYPLAHHQEWDARVRAITGGMTIFKTAKGHWVDDEGELFVEEMIPVRIACSRSQLEEIARITLTHYDQRAVYTQRVSDEVIIWRGE